MHMNWLAHLVLSEPSPAFRLGGVLPDFARPALLAHLGPEFQLGMRRHHQVDAFTDSHPVVRRSVQRIEPPFRRFGGILVDVFYDHFLTREWNQFVDQPLKELVAEFYRSIDIYGSEFPVEVAARLQQMRAADWLGSYGEVEGIANALTRISDRLRRPFNLGGAAAILEREYGALADDFAEFFPKLETHVKRTEIGGHPKRELDQGIFSR